MDTCYADEHVDDKGNHQGNRDFNPEMAISALNMLDGYWWKEQLEHFNNQVYPEYIKNGSVRSAKEFLEK